MNIVIPRYRTTHKNFRQLRYKRMSLGKDNLDSGIYGVNNFSFIDSNNNHIISLAFTLDVTTCCGLIEMHGIKTDLVGYIIDEETNHKGFEILDSIMDYTINTIEEERKKEAERGLGVCGMYLTLASGHQDFLIEYFKQRDDFQEVISGVHNVKSGNNVYMFVRSFGD